MNSAIEKLDQITAADLDKLRHMLGAIPGRYTKKQWGFRNYFASANSDNPAMRRLESVGFVRQGASSGTMTYFHATEEGCKAVGMNAAQIKRAMED